MSGVHLSCAIMAHPKRSAAAHRLAASLPGLSPRVVLDPEPDGPPATLRTARAAWAAAPPGATHHLVLQDDAVPVAGMADALAGVLCAHPDLPVALFCEWGSGTGSMARWASMGGFGLAECVDAFVPTVGLALPVATASALVRAIDSHDPAEHDDEVVARFLEGLGRSAFVTVPNLVQHDGDTSLVGNDHTMGARRSALLARPGEAVAEDVLHAPGLVPFVSWRRARAAAIRWDTAAHRYESHVALMREELRQAGVEHADLCGALDRWAASPTGRTLEGALGYGLLHELWTVAAALAVFAPFPLGTPASPPSPDLTRALASLGPGGLRTVTPDAAQDPRTVEALGELAAAGFAFGARAAATCGPAPGIARPAPSRASEPRPGTREEGGTGTFRRREVG
ncbi:hypothetical protein [Nocardiopsis tropica]|uniref:Uncharacterized protein n=1 Tax=Nocardiopsis tropica TaxID=109330 RepID=A0ABV2A423_9ACTN